MSWEETSRHRYPCPCGKGEYEEVNLENDWFQHETRREMLCPECKQTYAYDGTPIGGHKWNEHVRGWVRKSVLEAEARRRERVIVEVRTVPCATWHRQL